MSTSKKSTAKVAPAKISAAPKVARSMVGPFVLPGKSKVTLVAANGAWAAGSKGAVFVGKCVGNGATVDAVIAAAAKLGITAAAAKAHLMWGFNHTWLAVSPAPAGVKPLGAPQRGRKTSAQEIAAVA